MFKGLINMFSKKETFTEGNEDDPPAVDPPAVDPPAVDPPAVDPPAVDPPAVDTGNETPETNNEPSKIILALNKFFNKDNLMMLLAFLGIFIVLYIALGIYFRIFGSGSQDSLVSAVNAIVLVAVSILGINKYYHLDNNKKNNLLEHLYTSFKDNIGDTETTFGLIVILGFIIGMQKILHLPTPEGNSSFVLDISNFLLWVVLLFNIIIICFTDLLNIPILTIIEDAVNSILYETVKSPLMFADDAVNNPVLLNLKSLIVVPYLSALTPPNAVLIKSNSSVFISTPEFKSVGFGVKSMNE